jgi:hypothetical protein
LQNILKLQQQIQIQGQQMTQQHQAQHWRG